MLAAVRRNFEWSVPSLRGAARPEEPAVELLAKGDSEDDDDESVSSKDYELLLAHHEALLSALRGQDLEKMVKLLCGYRLVSAELKESFLSLQCDKGWDQQRQLRSRYLLQLVYEKVRRHKSSFNRLLKWLKGMKGEGEKVYDILCKERATDLVREAGEVQDTERCLTEDDIPELICVRLVWLTSGRK